MTNGNYHAYNGEKEYNNRRQGCWCGNTAYDIELICTASGEICRENCAYYTSNKSWLGRIIFRIFNGRRPRPDCEQAEYKQVCECGEIYDK